MKAKNQRITNGICHLSLIFCYDIDKILKIKYLFFKESFMKNIVEKFLKRNLSVVFLVAIGFFAMAVLAGCPNPTDPTPRPRTNLEFVTDWINEGGTALHPTAGRVNISTGSLSATAFKDLVSDNPDVTLEELALLIAKYRLLTDLIPPFIESERGYTR